jgi:CspA family cold shock protein
MPKGTIRQVMDRGFGFIKTEDGKDLFFHRNEIEGVEFSSLKAGDGVEFETGQDKKGRPQAVKVRLTQTQETKPPPA